MQESDDEAEAVDVEDEHPMPDDEEIVEAEEDEMFSDTKEDELDEEEVRYIQPWLRHHNSV